MDGDCWQRYKQTQQVDFLLSIPAVDTLQRVWKQDYLPQDLGGTWIADENRLEAARLFYSPYDLDASAAKKRSTYWIGYKVHFTPNL
jgi:transposase